MCVECKGNHKITIDDCQSIAHSRDGECLSTIYINNHSKLVWKCFNGVRYHSFEMMMVRFNGNIDKALNYHQMKTDRCLALGIDLMHIDEKGWMGDKKSVLESVKNAIVSRLLND